MNVNSMNAISELNLSYLLLAQRMIRDSEPEAMLRLGFSQEIARLIVALTPAQLFKLCFSGQLLCSFRLDDPSLLEDLVSETPLHDLLPMKLAILMTSQSVETIN